MPDKLIRCHELEVMGKNVSPDHWTRNEFVGAACRSVDRVGQRFTGGCFTGTCGAALGDPRGAFEATKKVVQYSSVMRQKLIHSRGVTQWEDEPIFPAQLFVVRNGQAAGVGALSSMGKMQIAATTAFLEQVTGGFSNVEAVWSSVEDYSIETARIIRDTAVKRVNKYRGLHRTDERDPVIPIVAHPLLGEFVPPGKYRTTRELTDGEEAEFQADIRAMERGKRLIAAGLHGRGLLAQNLSTANKFVDKHPANFCGDTLNSLLEGEKPETLLSLRCPAVVKKALRVLGVYLRSPTYRGSRFARGAIKYVEAAHGTAMRYQIFSECGFPDTFWIQIQIPQGAVVMSGLHFTGGVGLVVADAAALISMSTPSLPMTFSAYEVDLSPSGALAEVVRGAQPIDEDPPRTQPREWFQRQAYPGVAYNAPRYGAVEKTIVLMRHGHNAVQGRSDQGLTELGFAQVRVMSEWLGRYLSSGVLQEKPSRWTVSGVTESTVDRSIEETIDMVKRSTTLVGFQFEVLETSALALLPERLMGATSSAQEGLLHVVVGGTEQLLQYLGYAFSLDSKVLPLLFWPHAGVVILSITEEGWVEAKIFGQSSHLPIDALSLYDT